MFVVLGLRSRWFAMFRMKPALLTNRHVFPLQIADSNKNSLPEQRVAVWQVPEFR